MALNLSAFRQDRKSPVVQPTTGLNLSAFRKPSLKQDPRAELRSIVQQVRQERPDITGEELTSEITRRRFGERQKPSIVLETIKGLPEATEKVALFIKGIQEEISRSGASVALTAIAGGVERLAPKITGISPQEAKRRADKIRRLDIEGDKIAQLIFGKEPLESIETRIARGELNLQEFAKGLQEGRVDIPIIGEEREVALGEFIKGKELPIALIGIPLIIGLDFLGGGGRRVVVKLISQSTDVLQISKTLKEINVADDLIEPTAKKLAGMTDEKAIAKALDNLDAIQRTTKVAKEAVEGVTPTPRLKPVTREVRAAERVGVQSQIAIRARELDDLATKGDFKLLRQRITDRFTFIKRGIREGSITTRANIKIIQKELIDIAESAKKDFGIEVISLRALKNIQTLDQLAARLPGIETRILKLGEVKQVGGLQKQLQKQVDTFTPKKDKKGVLVGKLTPDKQEEFDAVIKALREAPKTDSADDIAAFQLQMGERIQKNIQLLDKGLDPRDELKIVLENEALSVAGSLGYRKIALESGSSKLEKLSKTIDEITAKGQTERARIAFNESDELKRVKEFLGEDVVLAGEKLDTSLNAAPLEESIFRRAMDKITSYRDQHLNIDFWSAKAESFYPSRPFKAGDPEGPWFKETNKLHEARRNYASDVSSPLTGDEKRLQEIVWKAYNITKAKEANLLENKFNTVVKLGTFTLRNGVVKKISMTRKQLIAKWMQAQQEQGLIRLRHGNQWSDEVFDAVNAAMKPEDKVVGQSMIDEFYPPIRDAVNPVHEKMTGLRIGEEVNYNPLPVTLDKDMPDQLRLIAQEFHRKSTTPSAVKARLDLTKIADEADVAAIEFDDFIGTALSHAMQMRRYQHFTEPIRNMRRILTGDSRKALVQRFSREFPQIMDRMLDDLARGGAKDTSNLQWLNTLRGNMATSVFGLNPTQFPKQLTSSILWVLEENPINLARWTPFWTKNMRKVSSEMWENSPFLQLRGIKRTFDRDAKLAQESRDMMNLVTGRKGLVDLSLAFVRAGDKAGIYSFGGPYYLFHKARLLKEGLPEKEAINGAIKLFERAAKRIQQAAEVEDLGQIQRLGPIGNLFTLFRGTILQLFRWEEHSIRSLGIQSRLGIKLGVKDAPIPKGSIAENLSKIALIHAQFMLFQFAADGLEFRPERQLRAGLLGPFGAPIIIGNALDTVARTLVGDDVFEKGIGAAGLSRVGELASKGTEGVTGAAEALASGDFEEFVSALRGILIGVGDLKGLPASNMEELIEKSIDFAVGRRSDIRELIYSDYALDIKGGKSRGGIPSIEIPSISIPSIDIPSISI